MSDVVTFPNTQAHNLPNTSKKKSPAMTFRLHPFWQSEQNIYLKEITSILKI